MNKIIATKDPILAQLNRVRGQLDGVVKMYQEQRSCVEIVHQVIAARSAMGRISRDLLTCEASACSKEKRLDDLDEILKEVFRY